MIRDAIRYHMWIWCQIYNEDEANKETVRGANETEVRKAINCNNIERIVQLADYIASRKNVSFIPGIEIMKTPI